MRKTILIISIIFTLLTACSERKSNNASRSEISTVTTNISDESKTTTLDLSYNFWLLLVSLGLNAISITLIIYLLLKQRGLRDKVIDIVTQSHRIDDFVESKINFPTKTQAKTVHSAQKEQKKTRFSDDEKTSIIEELQALIRLDIAELVAEQSNNMPKNEEKIENEKTTTYLYASSANKSTDEFYTIMNEPNTKTIYRLTLNQDRQSASFDVFADAHSKVLQCPDFLEGACDLQDSGSQKITTKKQGEARKQADGKWKIISQAKIIFE